MLSAKCPDDASCNQSRRRPSKAGVFGWIATNGHPRHVRLFRAQYVPLSCMQAWSALLKSGSWLRWPLDLRTAFFDLLHHVRQVELRCTPCMCSCIGSGCLDRKPKRNLRKSSFIIRRHDAKQLSVAHRWPKNALRGFLVEGRRQVLECATTATFIIDYGVSARLMPASCCAGEATWAWLRWPGCGRRHGQKILQRCVISHSDVSSASAGVIPSLRKRLN